MTEAAKTIWNLFGKNQWIGIAIHGTTLLVAVAVTKTSSVTTGNDLLSFLQWWGPCAVGSMTLPSAGVKVAQSRNGAGKVGS